MVKNVKTINKIVKMKIKTKRIKVIPKFDVNKNLSNAIALNNALMNTNFIKYTVGLKVYII
jgi:hypothetical protein